MRCYLRGMDQALSRVLTMSAISLCAGVLTVAACTRTTDRVIEPIGGGDASTTTPELDDAGPGPIGPIAHPIEPAEDYRLVRAPEFGLAIARQAHFTPADQGDRQAPGLGGSDGSAGMAGSDRRPVSSGGSYF